jgi:hypothetical protein
MRRRKTLSLVVQVSLYQGLNMSEERSPLLADPQVESYSSSPGSNSSDSRSVTFAGVVNLGSNEVPMDVGSDEIPVGTQRADNRSFTFGVDKRSNGDKKSTTSTVGSGIHSIKSDSIIGKKSTYSPAGSGGQASTKRRKKKRKGIALNFDSAMELEYQVQINLVKHNLAAQFYSSRQFWLFTIPQGLLTMLTSILAFVATSGLLSEVTKTVLSTIVGSTSGIVVFLQTMSGVCNYGTRAAMHASACIDLRDLRDEIVLIKFKVKKEEEQGIESGSGDTINETKAEDDESGSDSDNDEEAEKEAKEHDNIFARIQSRYKQSLSGCKSNVPMPLSEAFNGLHSNLLVSESMDNTIYMRDIYGPKKNFKNIIYFKAYDILASEILASQGFPIFLPPSKQVVDRAMFVLNEEINKYHSYWDNKLDELRLDNLEEEKFCREHSQLAARLRQSRYLDADFGV